MLNKDYDKQLYVAQLALREYIAGYGLMNCWKEKSIAPFHPAESASKKAEALGVEVNGFGIRHYPAGCEKEIMNQVPVAKKEASANSIMRREELPAPAARWNTAKLMEENDAVETG